MSRLTAVRYACRVIDSLSDRDPGSLAAARAAADRLSYELAVLDVIENQAGPNLDRAGAPPRATPPATTAAPTAPARSSSTAEG